MPGSPTLLLTSAAALAAVLGLIILLGRLARRAGWGRLVQGRPTGARGRGRLSLEDGLAIDARLRIHIIRCDGRDCLVLTGPTGGRMLGWLERDPS